MHALSRPLIVGVTGIAGQALAERLTLRGGHVLGLSRSSTSSVREVESLHADLTDADRSATSSPAPGRPRVRHRVVAPGDRGGEHPGQRRDGPRRPRRRRRRAPAARGADDRASSTTSARSRPTARAHAGDPVPGDPAPPGRPELLLRPGGRALEPAARTVHLEVHRAHTMVGYARQRDEHRVDPRRLRHDVPGDGPAVHVPRLGAAVERHHRHLRRRAGRRAHDLGDGAPCARPGAQRRERGRVPVALDVAGARRAPGGEAEGFDGTAARSRSQTEGMEEVWTRIAERENLRETTSVASRRSGTPTATSAATSSASPT